MTALPVATGRQSAARLWLILRGHPFEGMWALLLTVSAGAAVVAVPVSLGWLVDQVRAHGPVGLPLSLVSAGVVLSTVLSALAQRSVERLGARVTAQLRTDVVTRVLHLPASTVERAGHGDVTSRVTEDVDEFTAAVPLLATVWQALAVFAVSIAAFTALHWGLLLTFAVVLPVYVRGLRTHLSAAGPLYAAERHASAERGRVLLESVHGVSTVHAYDMAALQNSRVAHASHAALTAGLRALRRYVWFSKTMNAAEAIGLAAVLLIGYWLVRAETISVGEVTAAALLFHRLFDPLGTLLLYFDDVQRAGASLARIVGVSTARTAPVGIDLVPGNTVGITVTDIHHSYDGVREVLRGVDLAVPAGTSLAIVGTSGAGKSTLAAIIAGELTPTTGTVVCTDQRGSTPVPALSAGSLRDWIGLISQETHLFTGTLRDNLTFAAPLSTDADIAVALRATAADRWIHALPDGLDTRVASGDGRLTAAQVQHLAVTRLLLRDPPVVVMDEATADGGSSGARDLDLAAMALTRDRTAVVIAHRLSQARVCDRIAVLHDGQVLELGSHAELIARDGHYARLWTAWSATGMPEDTRY